MTDGEADGVANGVLLAAGVSDAAGDKLGRAVGLAKPVVGCATGVWVPGVPTVMGTDCMVACVTMVTRAGATGISLGGGGTTVLIGVSVGVIGLVGSCVGIAVGRSALSDERPFRSLEGRIKAKTDGVGVGVNVGVGLRLRLCIAWYASVSENCSLPSSPSCTVQAESG